MNKIFVAKIGIHIGFSNELNEILVTDMNLLSQDHLFTSLAC